MDCIKCGARMTERSAKLAQSEAPKIYVCTHCGATYIEQEEELKEI